MATLVTVEANMMGKSVLVTGACGHRFREAWRGRWLSVGTRLSPGAKFGRRFGNCTTLRNGEKRTVRRVLATLKIRDSQNLKLSI